MKSNFNDMGISSPILKAIKDMGFETPTEVQSQAIPHILNGEDVIVMSKTGSGKTAVFGIPMLQLTNPEGPGPQGLILTPTRELAVQIDSDIRQMSRYLKRKTTVVYGQHSMNVEIQALNKGIHIVTGTPGRVYDHIGHGNLSTKHIRFLVLDEADRMLDMGFFDQVMDIVKTIPKDRMTLLFSATMPSEIRKIGSEHMRQPVTVEIESETKTVDTIKQMYYRVKPNEKRTQLYRLLQYERPESCMIFCNTKIAVDQVQGFLSRKGYGCEALHGDIPQGKRISTMQQFKQGKFHILVATDVAARGIDINNLSLVINYDVPNEKDNYIHRVGRTGRAGKEGRAITLVTGDDIMSLYEIEEHIGSLIPEEELPADAVLNEQKAEIDKWIQANSQKITQPADTQEPHLRRTSPSKPSQPRPSNTKPNQQRDNYRNRTMGVGWEYRTDNDSHTTHPDDQAKPVRPASKPMVSNSKDTHVDNAKQAAEVVQKAPDSTAKKPLLQRILQRMFGK